jgi:hypothetical protein
MNMLFIRMSFQPTLWGILRIVVWACLFLYLFAIFLPEPQPTRTDPIESGWPDLIPMKLEEGDLKWVRQKPDLLSSRATIAWVADSSAKVNGFDPLTRSRVIQALPAQVMLSLDSDFNNKLNMLFYYTKGRREAETYTLLLEAISQKPDAIVVTLNPFWVFNQYAIAQADSRFGTALNNRGFNLDHLIFSSLLVYPRDTAFSLVGNSFRLFRDNLGYHRLFVHDTTSPTTRASSDKPDELIDVYFKYPLNFWLDMGGKWHGDRVRKLMRVSNPERAFWNQYFLRLSLERLTESGIPTFIYLAPVNPELMKNEADADSYLVVMNALQKYFANPPPNIKFDLRIPPEITASIKFADLYHYSDSGMLPNFLASQIQNTLGGKIEKVPH